MRDTRFTFLCTIDERRLLANLAAKLSRTQGDLIRLLIRETADQLAQRNDPPPAERPEGAHA